MESHAARLADVGATLTTNVGFKERSSVHLRLMEWAGSCFQYNFPTTLSTDIR